MLVSRYKICKRYHDDIWGDILTRQRRGKTIKFVTRIRRIREKLIRPTFYFFLSFDMTFPRRYKWPKAFYGRLLVTIQKIKKFYRNIREYQFRSIFSKSNITFNRWLDHFYFCLERRIDVILYRSNFVKTFGIARKLILYGKVTINNIKITCKSNTLNLGDILGFLPSKKLIKDIKQRLYNKQIFLYYPSYLEVNYKTLTTIYI